MKVSTEQNAWNLYFAGHSINKSIINSESLVVETRKEMNASLGLDGKAQFEIFVGVYVYLLSYFRPQASYYTVEMCVYICWTWTEMFLLFHETSHTQRKWILPHFHVKWNKLQMEYNNKLPLIYYILFVYSHV